jgi:hypothetical protein
MATTAQPCAQAEMNQNTEKLPTSWQDFPESYFTPPSQEEREDLHDDILRYAVEQLHIPRERAELYAKVFSTDQKQ